MFLLSSILKLLSILGAVVHTWSRCPYLKPLSIPEAVVHTWDSILQIAGGVKTRKYSVINVSFVINLEVISYTGISMACRWSSKLRCPKGRWGLGGERIASCISSAFVQALLVAEPFHCFRLRTSWRRSWHFRVGPFHVSNALLKECNGSLGPLIYKEHSALPTLYRKNSHNADSLSVNLKVVCMVSSRTFFLTDSSEHRTPLYIWNLLGLLVP